MSRKAMVVRDDDGQLEILIRADHCDIPDFSLSVDDAQALQQSLTRAVSYATSLAIMDDQEKR